MKKWSFDFTHDTDGCVFTDLGMMDLVEEVDRLNRFSTFAIESVRVGYVPNVEHACVVKIEFYSKDVPESVARNFALGVHTFAESKISFEISKATTKIISVHPYHPDYVAPKGGDE